MTTGTKNRRWILFIGLGFIVFLGQVLETGAYAKGLSVQARRVLDDPAKKMKPSIQQELRRAWERAVIPVFQEFLPGLEDKFSFHVRAVSINNKPVIYFLAKGKKRSPDATPVTQLKLEVFINTGEKFFKRRFGYGIQPLSVVNEKLENTKFVGDRANFNTLSGAGVEAFFWQKDGQYIELRSQRDVEAIAQKVQLKLQSLNFYDFSAFLLKQDNGLSTMALARVKPSLDSNPPKELTSISPVEAEPAGQWAYKGCFKDVSSDNVVNRDVFGYLINGNDMTTEKCQQHCRTAKYSIAATQFGKWCFCGSDFGSFGKADNCNMGCAGNPKEICGGRWANSVYKLAPKLPSRLKRDP